MNLAVKYRPHEFNEVCGQTSTIKILERQIETKTFSNCYMLCGASGCGKTTIARIMANKINKGLGQPIEIDGASNNGVDNVRLIADQAQERSLDSEYKVYIIDECHMITTNAWNALLKIIEEPPKYTLFMFCTTDPQKVPQTIMNRCQVFTFSSIDDRNIQNRLEYICKCEGYTYEPEALEIITRIAGGSMRQAITLLDKCKDYSINLTRESVSNVLGNFTYDLMFDLTNSVVDHNVGNIINIIESLYSTGTDLKTFISNYLNFILQVNKYILFSKMDGVSIPESYENKIRYTIGIDNNKEWFSSYLDKILKIKQTIKNDTDIKTTMEVMLIGN